MNIKIGGILHLNEARYCSGMGVDMVGFPLGDDLSQLSFETFKEIVGWIEGPKAVAELSYHEDMNSNLVDQIRQSSKISYVQLHHHQGVALTEQRMINKPIILCTDNSEWAQIIHKLNALPIAYVLVKKLEEESNETYWQGVNAITPTIPALADYNHLPIGFFDHLEQNEKRRLGIAFHTTYTTSSKEVDSLLYDMLETIAPD